MRLKMLGLMRERNLYLEKCRAVEQFGERIDWQGTSDDDTEFLNNIHEILYMQQGDSEESLEAEMQEHSFSDGASSSALNNINTNNSRPGMVVQSTVMPQRLPGPLMGHR